MAPLTIAQENQLAVAQGFLDQYGLGDLTETVKTWIIQGYSPERIDLELRNPNTDAGKRFFQEFPEIFERQQKGLTAMSPEDVINYRQQVTDTFSRAGFPRGFYDERKDFVDLVGKDLSVDEIQFRVEQGFMKVQNAPQEIKDVFDSFFGAQGENALAMFFLDPNRAEIELQKQVQQAEIGGTGRRFGFNVEKSLATRLQEIGVTGQSATQGFGQAAELRPLSEETISEETDIAEGELIGATLGQDVEAKRRLERRGQERQAAFGGGGGAGQTQRGFGIGSSR